eukprot:scaffold66031_cov33-Prasinocladus_malaysianus.AAC.1
MPFGCEEPAVEQACQVSAAMQRSGNNGRAGEHGQQGNPIKPSLESKLCQKIPMSSATIFHSQPVKRYFGTAIRIGNLCKPLVACLHVGRLSINDSIAGNIAINMPWKWLTNTGAYLSLAHQPIHLARKQRCTSNPLRMKHIFFVKQHHDFALTQHQPTALMQRMQPIESAGG